MISIEPGQPEPQSDEDGQCQELGSTGERCLKDRGHDDPIHVSAHENWETETPAPTPEFDPNATHARLQELIAQRDSYAAEATRVLNSIRGEIEYVNDQRLAGDAAAQEIRETIFAFLQDLTDRIRKESLNLRRRRKSVPLDRLDFLDTYRIWTMKDGSPVWWLLDPFLQLNQWELQQPGAVPFPESDMFWGIECPQVISGRTTIRRGNRSFLLDLEPLDQKRIEYLHKTPSRMLVVMTGAGYIRRIPSLWFKEFRAIDRGLYETPIPDNAMLAELFALYKNSQGPTKLDPIEL